MAGDHACPVCGSRFTRPQHVTRHMRSHTGDRPYKCTQCGDQFARSDLLSRHVNKCHNGAGGSTGRGNRRNTHSGAATTNAAAAVAQSGTSLPCDLCIQSRQQCDLGSPCGKCLLRKAPCTYSTKNAAANDRTGHARRVSLPSLTQAGQPYLLPGQAPPISGQSAQFATAYGGPQPVPMPNGQYIGNDSYSLFGLQGGDQSAGLRLSNELPQLSQQPAMNTLGGPLPRLGSLSFPLQSQGQQYPSRPPPLQQAYAYGHDNQASALPPLTAADPNGFAPSEGSPNPRIDPAAYLQQSRGSLQSTGHGRTYSASEPFHSSPLQAQHNQFQLPPVPLDGQQPMFASQSYPASYQQGSPQSSGSRGFDGSRYNERMTSARGYNQDGDASSVSDFGSNSGAPSPVPSSHSITFSSSSRPTSSAGSKGPGVDGQSGQSDNFASLQGAIPLPTPLQLGSFSSFGGQGNTSSNDRTPGVHTDGAGKALGAYPPYQSLEQMNLDEAASFAAAAKNASNTGAYGSSVPSGSLFGHWQPGQSYNTSALGPPTQSMLSAGGKERAINELKDFWSDFISEPLTGGGSGPNNGSNHSLTKQLSMPTLKTPLPTSSERTSILGELNHPTPRAVYPSGNGSLLEMMYKPDGHSKDKRDGPVRPATSQAVAPPPTSAEEEGLKSYQEACLKRETPMLRLQPRPKSRLVHSTSTSPQARNSGSLPNVGFQDAEMKSQHSGDGRDKAFALPYLPGSKEARDWNHIRQTSDTHAAAGTAALRAMSIADPTSVSSRPSYKRLASQTLGPESAKKTRDGSALTDSDGDGANSGGSDAGDPIKAEGYQVSYPHPAYNNNQAAAHGAWMRQRSMSSPTGTRPQFDWQTLGSTRN